MPNFDTHFKYGKLASIATGLVTLIITLNPLATMLSVFNTIFSSLYPDADIKSHSQKFVLISLLLICSLTFILNKIVLSPVIAIAALLIVIPMLSKHRGITHNYLFSAVLQTVLIVMLNLIHPMILGQNIAIMVSGYIGCMTHLIADKVKFKLI